MATGELEDELEGHTRLVWSVAFSHNGQFLVSGLKDMSVWIWNMATCDTRYADRPYKWCEVCCNIKG